MIRIACRNQANPMAHMVVVSISMVILSPSHGRMPPSDLPGLAHAERPME
jgi:hypothetical protein